MPFGEISPARILQEALATLMGLDLRIIAVSRFFCTPCFPQGAGPDYVNAAAELACDLDPGGLLERLHAVEARFDRKRVTRWGMRTLDLDLICLDQAVLPDAATQADWRNLPADQQIRRAPDRLILPHPRLQDRAFVLVPMADIVPDWRHPLLHRTVREMRDSLPAREIDAVRPL